MRDDGFEFFPRGLGLGADGQALHHGDQEIGHPPGVQVGGELAHPAGLLDPRAQRRAEGIALPGEDVSHRLAVCRAGDRGGDLEAAGRRGCVG